MNQVARCLRYAAACALLLSITACSHSRDESTAVPRWAISFRWSAAPGIDLDSIDMQVVRGTIESNTIAMFLNIDYGYPGWKDFSHGAVGVVASIPHSMSQGIGTAYLHVVQLETPGGTRNVVCQDMTETAKKVGDKYLFPDINNPRETLQAVTVDVAGSRDIDPSYTSAVKNPQGPVIPGPPGRSSRPKTNVFVQFPSVGYTKNGMLYRDLCTPWIESRWGGPQPPKPTRTENEPPKVEPFTPGWED